MSQTHIIQICFDLRYRKVQVTGNRVYEQGRALKDGLFNYPTEPTGAGLTSTDRLKIEVPKIRYLLLCRI